jgi:cytochrome b561
VAADIDDALIASGNPARRIRQISALYWGVAVLAVMVGVFGLVRDSWLAIAPTSRSCVHALFALLLAGLVIARFLWWLKHSPPAQKADIRRFSRQLSRLIYLVLYLVIGTQQIIVIVNFMWHGGTLDFGLLLDNDSVQDLGIYKSTADFRAILVCGLIALALIRGLAFWTWLRLVEEVAIRAAADLRSGETQTSCVRNSPMSQAVRASSSSS